MDQTEKFIRKLRPSDRRRLMAVLEDLLLGNVRNYDVRKLRGSGDFYRIRMGKIRIVFTKGDEGIVIVAVDFRKDVYR